MKSLYIATAIIVLAACSKKMMVMSQSDADRGAAKFPGTTVESLSIGKTNYEANCSKCHFLKSPASQTEEQWRAVVPRMVVKANKKAGKTEIDSAMQESILRYVVTMSTAPKK